MNKPLDAEFFATCGARLDDMLAEELAAILGKPPKTTRGGVRWRGPIDQAVEVLLWSRLASRILLVLADFEVEDANSIHAAAAAVDWLKVIRPGARFSIDVGGAAKGVSHTLFAAQRLRDAIIDRLRAAEHDAHPVPIDQADLIINLALRGGRALISIDLGHGPLHQRSYRVEPGLAPLRETLAAAVLWRCRWPELAAQGAPLIDPFCGAGTLLIEAAWMAADVAPGLGRAQRVPSGWQGFDQALWTDRAAAARARADAGLKALRLPIYGFDRDPKALNAARRNLQEAGLAGHVRLAKADAAQLQLPADAQDGHRSGLIVANLPYGERLSDQRSQLPLHRAFGERLTQIAVGWRFALLTGSQELAKATGLRAEKVLAFANGPLECRLILGEVQPPRAPAVVDQDATPRFRRAGTEMVYNRLRKNQTRWAKWAKREGLECFRLYDADLPEYAAAIDLYAGRAHVQEYAAPASIPADTAAERLQDLLYAVEKALELGPESIYLKRREKRREGRQYQRQANKGDFFAASEGGLQFWINLEDYLDSGLFLDSRLLRAMVRERAEGRRFLNLFCYTGSATVYAAAGGARESVSVDLSPTYVDWAARNFQLNGVDLRRHSLVQADVLRWLREYRGKRFDLIYLDPPTFSNSKRTDTVFDVQRDHPDLVRACLDLLNPDGELLFVCNRERFDLDPQLISEHQVEDLGKRTIPEDFARRPRVHHAYLIKARELPVEDAWAGWRGGAGRG